VRRFVQSLPNDQAKATVILDFAPGEAAQVDFGAGPKLIDLHTGEIRSSWFFIMTLCYSRHQYAEIVFNQKVATWLACHRKAFERYSSLPQHMTIRWTPLHRRSGGLVCVPPCDSIQATGSQAWLQVHTAWEFRG